MPDEMSGYQKALQRFHAEKGLARSSVSSHEPDQQSPVPQEAPETAVGRGSPVRTYCYIGLAVFLALVGFTGWQAFRKTEGVVEVRPPSAKAIEVPPPEARQRDPKMEAVAPVYVALLRGGPGAGNRAFAEQPPPPSEVLSPAEPPTSPPSRPIRPTKATDDGDGRPRGSSGYPAIDPLAETTPGQPAIGLALSEGAEQGDKRPLQPETDGVPVLPEGDGGYLLQVAAVRRSSDVESTWLAIRNSFPTLLGDKVLHVEKVAINSQTYYRIQATPFTTKAAAEELCLQLKAENQDCLVKRRSL